MKYPRALFTVTLLPSNNRRCIHETVLINDSVFTVGGYDADGNSKLVSYEKYYF